MRPAPGDANPQRLLAEAAAGKAEAWRLLVANYTPRVYALLLRQCGDRELAEELTQDTFVRLVTDLGRGGRYREQGRFEPWLFRVAMNRLRDEMRRRRRQATPTDFSAVDQGETALAPLPGAPAAGADPAELASKAEQMERVRRAVARLGEADRQIVHLRHTAGLSFREIAQTLEQPLGTVLARSHRAVAKLRKMLQDEHPE